MKMETQRCVKCERMLPLDREHFGHVKKTGKHRTICRQCESRRVLEYKKKNPESDRKLTRERLDRLNGWRPDPGLKGDLYHEQGGVCALCGEALGAIETAQVEHLIPTVKGGGNDAENLVLAHSKCNQEKHGKSLLEYIQWRERVGLPRSTFSSHKIMSAIGRSL